MLVDKSLTRGFDQIFVTFQRPESIAGMGIGRHCSLLQRC